MTDTIPNGLLETLLVGSLLIGFVGRLVLRRPWWLIALVLALVSALLFALLTSISGFFAVLPMIMAVVGLPVFAGAAVGAGLGSIFPARRG